MSKRCFTKIAKSPSLTIESGLIQQPQCGNDDYGSSQGGSNLVSSEVIFLAEENGSQGRTEQRIRVDSGHARNATCWRKPKQKQS